MILTLNKPRKKQPRKVTTRTVSSVVQRQTAVYSGPIPNPIDLQKYNEVLPNAAERIITMAEKEQEGRITLQQEEIKIHKTLIESEFSYRKTGQIIGGIIGLAGLGISAFLGYVGQSGVASIIGGGTVLSLVSVFVTGKLAQKKDRKESR